MPPKKINRPIDPSSIHRLKPKGVLKRYRRAATAYKSWLWPNGILHYAFSANFPSHYKVTVMSAMKEWENYTCLNFVPKRISDATYINFIHNDECGSKVGKGYLPQPRDLDLADYCNTKEIVLHELGHAIGFWHEHIRPDRDNYVEIFLDNILSDYKSEFEIKEAYEINSLNETYDFDSIMHYAPTEAAISRNNNTMRARNGNPKIGGAMNLSAGDIRQTNKLYSCPKCFKSLLEDKGNFRSPERELNWTNVGPLDCTWRISVTVGNGLVLEIKDLETLNSTDCGANFLEIRDGIYNTSNIIGRFCSTVPMIIIQGKRMVIRYKNVSPSITTGFVGNYRGINMSELAVYGFK